MPKPVGPSNGRVEHTNGASPVHPEPAAAARPGRRVRVNAAAAGSSDVSGTNGAADRGKDNEEAPGDPADGPEPAPEAAH